MERYVIIKQFRDSTGLRLPGETIELTPPRAAALRGSGLVGDICMPETEKKEVVEKAPDKAEPIKAAGKPKSKSKGKAGR